MATRPTLPPHEARPDGAPLALSNIRVVDFTRVYAGPFVTNILSDLGAEVIKIEDPGGGDRTRQIKPPAVGSESSFFLALNRNKMSISLDLTKREAIDVILDLLAGADVLVENYTTRVMQKFGLEYAAIAERFPRLVYCSISAYGRTGSLANAPGLDPIAAAECGVTFMSTGPDAPLAVNGMPFMDMTTGMNATIGILGALYAREYLGRGQFIDLSMFDTAIHDLSHFGYHFLVTGENPPRTNEHQPTGLPNGRYFASDGPFHLICNQDRQFSEFCTKVLRRPELAEQADFRTREDRIRNQDQLHTLLDEIFRSDVRATWVDRLRAAAMPAAPINTIEEALTSDLVGERKMLSEIEHPVVGPIPNIRSPLRLSLTPTADPVAAPLLGEHTEQILKDRLNYNDETIRALALAGVFGAGSASPPGA